MDRTTAQEKGIVELEHIEIVQDNAAQLQPTHYRPQTDVEKALDKRVNRKLDLIVVTLLAVEFIVSDFLES
jgi:CMP-N-acetylneuraminic acid synthetase